MTIAVQDHVTVSGTSGTTINTSASFFSPAAGCWIMVQVAIVPTNANVTFSQTDGTAILGSFSTPVVVRFGGVNLWVSWVQCTGTGTCQITASSDQTITSATYEAISFSGSNGGPGQYITGTGNTGTDISLTLTTIMANSWLVIAASAIQAGFLQAGANTTRHGAEANTSTISSAVGANDAPLSPGTTLDLHLTDLVNGHDYAAIMFELVGDSVASGEGTIAASATVVASSLKAGSGSISATATLVASSPLAPEAGISAAATAIPAEPPPQLLPPGGPPIPGAPWAEFIMALLEEQERSFTPPTPTPRTSGPAASPVIPRYNPKAMDKDRQDRLQRITDMVQQIVNSLHGIGELTVSDMVQWHLGYRSGVSSYWNGTAPTTVKEALDRIALAIKQLNGMGP